MQLRELVVVVVVVVVAVAVVVVVVVVVGEMDLRALPASSASFRFPRKRPT